MMIPSKWKWRRVERILLWNGAIDATNEGSRLSALGYSSRFHEHEARGWSMVIKLARSKSHAISRSLTTTIVSARFTRHAVEIARRPKPMGQ